MASAKLDDDILIRLQNLRENHGASEDISEISEIVESILLANGGEPATNIEPEAPFVNDDGVSNPLDMHSLDILRQLNMDSVIIEQISAFSDEFDAIVAATAESADGIMEAAESIGEVAAKVGEKESQILESAVTAIFESCSFQDITGQRIANLRTKVEFIEHKMLGVLAAMGDPDAERRFAEGEMARTENVGREDDDLLNGPQLEGDGVSQEEIDKLLASFD
jgi:chemotaxis protein CheZ